MHFVLETFYNLWASHQIYRAIVTDINVIELQDMKNDVVSLIQVCFVDQPYGIPYALDQQYGWSIKNKLVLS